MRVPAAEPSRLVTLIARPGSAVYRRRVRSGGGLSKGCRNGRIVEILACVAQRRSTASNRARRIGCGCRHGTCRADRRGRMGEGLQPGDLRPCDAVAGALRHAGARRLAARSRQQPVVGRGVQLYSHDRRRGPCSLGQARHGRLGMGWPGPGHPRRLDLARRVPDVARGRHADPRPARRNRLLAAQRRRILGRSRQHRAGGVRYVRVSRDGDCAAGWPDAHVREQLRRRRSRVSRLDGPHHRRRPGGRVRRRRASAGELPDAGARRSGALLARLVQQRPAARARGRPDRSRDRRGHGCAGGPAGRGRETVRARLRHELPRGVPRPRAERLESRTPADMVAR